MTLNRMYMNEVCRASRFLMVRAILLLSVLLWWACGDSGSLITRSSGKPYEVVIMSDDTAAVNFVRDCLEIPVEGLPQEEPAFDVWVVDREVRNVETTTKRMSIYGAQEGAESRGARAIVKVVFNSHQRTGSPIHISYQRNVEVQPQIVVTLTAESVEQLRREKQRWEAPLRQLLTNFEQRATIALLRQHYNKQMSDTLQRLFGVKLLVPPDMLSAHYEMDFVWLSNNATTGMQNICVFKGTSIDSVIGKYIKGETDEMHMRLVENRDPIDMDRVSRAEKKKPKANLIRGLWEMEGDAMGGPYVARFFTDSITHQTTTVMAFVYSPETKKRNMIRKLEAVLRDASSE